MSFTRQTVEADTTEYQSMDTKVNEEVGTRGLRRRESGRRRTKTPSISLAIAKSFGGIFLAAAIFKVANDLLAFASPQILK